VIDVFLRYLFSSPLPSTGELTQFLLAITVFAGLVLISRDGGHVVVSLFEPQLTQRAPWLYNGLYAVSITVGAALILYILVLLAYDAWEFEETSIVTEFPMAWLIGFLAILTLLCLVVSFRVFLPSLQALGVDLIRFGIIIILVVELGLITPPIGMNVFTVKSVVTDVALSRMFAGVTPFIFAMIVALAPLILFPSIATWLPNLMR
jgi:TRAP-type mannitol/chloroaromatic compound transport system permease large subunit